MLLLTLLANLRFCTGRVARASREGVQSRPPGLQAFLRGDSLLDMLPRNDDVDKKQEQIHDCCGVKRLEELMSMEPKLERAPRLK